VETALRGAGLGNCVAMAVPGASGTHRIVAAAEETAPPDAVWLARVREHLPRHMIPETLERFATLPLTSNGKIDRKALAYQVRERLRAAAPQLPAAVCGTLQARSPTPETVAAFLKREIAALGGDRPGVFSHDRPLGEIGLGSLEFALLAGKLFEAYGLRVNPILFYETGTLGAAASRVSELAGAAQRSAPAEENAAPDRCKS
jgi:hypothetical protein